MAERPQIALFSAAIFASSSLLFLVQPMFGKMVLPRLGGTPAVWNTCVVFYQATLLVGYLYAHLSIKWMGVRRQRILHLPLLLLAYTTLPVTVAGGAPPNGDTPVWWLLGVLAHSIGPPFFVISTTAPLLQRWFAALPHPSADDPYFLYSTSNLGSMVALLAYPVLIEPNLRLTDQSWSWTVGYVLMAGLVAACALSLRAVRPAEASRSDVGSKPHPASQAPTGAQDATLALPSARSRALWLALSFVPSSLMLGVTTHISTDIAAVPLLWVLPLALYLLTFIIAFARRSLLSQTGISRLLPLVVTPTLLAIIFRWNAWWLVPLHLSTFFVAAAACHLRLAAGRPPVNHLTEFYLWIALGGVLGGLFNTLAAPVLFTSVVEYPLALAAACLLRASPAYRRRREESWALLIGVPTIVITACILARGAGLLSEITLPQLLVLLGLLWAAGLAFSNRQVLYGLVVGTAIVLVSIAPDTRERRVLYAARSFFGVHRVLEDRAFHTLQHGNTVHGLQARAAMETCEPASYYHRTGPLGQVFEALGGRVERVGVIGLGSGAAACYGRAGARWTFFEIDPTVERIARRERYFTYLRNTPAEVDVVLGDGRLTLANAPAGSFDLLIIDAFGSDSIPLHMATREAVDLYFSRLGPGGVLAFHISNRYLDLEPVLAAVAQGAALEARVNRDDAISSTERREGKLASRWLIMARSREAFGPLATDARWPAARRTGVDAWTDDFSNILSVFDWSADLPSAKRQLQR